MSKHTYAYTVPSYLISRSHEVMNIPLCWSYNDIAYLPNGVLNCCTKYMSLPFKYSDIVTISSSFVAVDILLITLRIHEPSSYPTPSSIQVPYQTNLTRKQFSSQQINMVEQEADKLIG